MGIGWHRIFRVALACGLLQPYRECGKLMLSVCQFAPRRRHTRCRPAWMWPGSAKTIVFGFEGTARIEWPERGVAVTLRSDPALSYLVIFIPPDRPFIAVEPVSHMIDAFHRAHLFLDTPRNTGFDPDTGLRVVAPRARFSVRTQLLCRKLLKTNR